MALILYLSMRKRIYVDRFRFFFPWYNFMQKLDRLFLGLGLNIFTTLFNKNEKIAGRKRIRRMATIMRHKIYWNDFFLSTYFKFYAQNYRHTYNTWISHLPWGCRSRCHTQYSLSTSTRKRRTYTLNRVKTNHITKMRTRKKNQCWLAWTIVL